MTDQPPPPSDKKPRRRSAPRKRAPAKRAAKAATTVDNASLATAETVDAATGADETVDAATGADEMPVSTPDAIAAKLDPHPLDDAGDRGDAPATGFQASMPVDRAEPAAGESAPTAQVDAATAIPAETRAPKSDRPATEASPSSPVTSAAAAPAATGSAPFPRQAELRPGELIRVPLSVRWRDLDAFNHVNNSKYLSYLEEARLRWMLALPGMGMDDDVAPVVAASNLNYRRPIEWPADVVIELFVERIGGSSLTIGHRIVDSKDGGTLYCDGNVVMVWIDRNTGRAAPLPPTVRTACR